MEVIKGSKPLLVVVEVAEGDSKEHEEMAKKLTDLQLVGSRYCLSIEAPGRNVWRRREVATIKGKTLNAEVKTNAREIVQEFQERQRGSEALERMALGGR